MQVSGNYSGDLNADVTGGKERGAAYLGKVSLVADFGLEKSLGLREGVVHVSFLNIHGTGLSGRYVGNLAAVSGIEAEPATRLNQAFVQSKIGALKVRIGKFPAAQDFAVSDVATLFVNSTFGWPASFAADLPDGGPSWPLAAPGIMVKGPIGSRITFSTALFAGDPVGLGTGDPQKHDGHGFRAFGFHGRPLIITEATLDLGSGSALKIGGWAHLGRFYSVAVHAADPQTLNANWAAYGIVDWSFPHSKQRASAWQAFARVTLSPKDRNAVAFYADGGIVLNAPLTARPDDTAGIAVAYIPPSRDISRAIRRAEWIVEASYKAAITTKAYLQPNMQIVRPFSGSSGSYGTPLATALVAGFRSSWSF